MTTTLHKIAWGITGSGDKLSETFDVMKSLKETYASQVTVKVYLSKAGEQVAKWYGLLKPLTESFEGIRFESGPNSPFLAGQLQLGKFDFLLIAPATSNTVAKIVAGICDTLISNSAIMAAKALVPVYVMPSDFKEGEIVTMLPNGKELHLRVRREDAENVRRVAAMEGFNLLKQPEDIRKLFKELYGRA